MAKGYIIVPVEENPRGGIKSRQNVAAGFHDSEGRFHPIRASFDYDPSRTGEAPKRKKKKKAPKMKRRTARR